MKNLNDVASQLADETDIPVSLAKKVLHQLRNMVYREFATDPVNGMNLLTRSLTLAQSDLETLEDDPA